MVCYHFKRTTQRPTSSSSGETMIFMWISLKNCGGEQWKMGNNGFAFLTNSEYSVKQMQSSQPSEIIIYSAFKHLEFLNGQKYLRIFNNFKNGNLRHARFQQYFVHLSPISLQYSSLPSAYPQSLVYLQGSNWVS